jgi:hypothetical protein
MDTITFLRQFRFAGFAIFDLAVTFLGMGIIAPFGSRLFKRFGVSIPKINWLFLALPIGFLAHLVVGRYTPMTVQLLDPRGHFAIKVIVLASLVFGLRNIKRS